MTIDDERLQALLSAMEQRIMRQIREATGGRMISVAEAAARMGVSDTTAWTMVRNGELKSTKVGGRRLVDPADLPTARDVDAEIDEQIAAARRGR